MPNIIIKCLRKYSNAAIQKAVIFLTADSTALVINQSRQQSINQIQNSQVTLKCNLNTLLQYNIAQSSTDIAKLCRQSLYAITVAPCECQLGSEVGQTVYSNLNCSKCKQMLPSQKRRSFYLRRPYSSNIGFISGK